MVARTISTSRLCVLTPYPIAIASLATTFALSLVSRAQDGGGDPEEVLTEFQFDFWRGYLQNDTLSHLPPADLATEGGVSVHQCNQWREKADHLAADCRFYPRVCGGNVDEHGTSDGSGNLSDATARGCRKFINMDPTWYTGFEATFDTLGLPLVNHYVGETENDVYRAIVAGMQEASSVVFYCETCNRVRGNSNDGS